VLQLEQVPTVLHELHNGVGGRHFSLNIIVKKILDANYWWLTTNKNVHIFVKLVICGNE
jgi:hypothetical protein